MQTCKSLANEKGVYKLNFSWRYNINISNLIYVIYMGHYVVFNGLVKALWLNIDLDFASGNIQPSGPIKPHEALYKERYYSINI